VPRFEATVSKGLCAPNSTPPEIIDKLSRKINAAPGRSKDQVSARGLGLVGAVRLVAEDTEKRAKMVKLRRKRRIELRVRFGLCDTSGTVAKPSSAAAVGVTCVQR
jgi:hypothetical protein